MPNRPRDTRNAPDPEKPVNERPPTPDEGGPHDVPDDEVIEQTLPTAATTSRERRGGDASDR